MLETDFNRRKRFIKKYYANFVILYIFIYYISLENEAIEQTACVNEFICDGIHVFPFSFTLPRM